MLKSTQIQNFQARLVLLSFSWLGNLQSNPHLQSIDDIQNLSSQDQNLRFIHLVWIPSGLSSRLHQGFPFKEQMNSHKCVLNLKLYWVTTSAYHSCLVPNSLPPTILVRCLPFSPKILIRHSHLTYPFTILRLSAINRRFGFIEAHREKHIESWNEDLLLSKSQILLLTNISCHRLIILNT